MFGNAVFSINSKGYTALPAGDSTAAQSIDLSASIYFNKFDREFYFDPDIELTVLFDTGEVSTLAVALGVTAGVVGALVVAGVALWFSPAKRFVFPFAQRESSGGSGVVKSALLESGARVEARPTSGAWQKGTAPAPTE
jgi:hypothetical protein